jgi:DNA-binding CsgD family transcriptional regulator
MTNVPMDRRSRQRIRYARGADGVQLAWADAGAGPVIVKAANWLTHLEYEWESPVWQHWIRFFTVIVPIAEGRLLAAAIPGAEFVELDSANHILLESEPAWTRFREAVLRFMGAEAPAEGEHPVFRSLSPREREVLALITDGLANAEIAGRLAISEKTVRNHVSHLFDKLGVWSRAQAIVFARDHGFLP